MTIKTNVEQTVITGILMKNMTRFDVLGKYAENLREKIAECNEEHAEETGPEMEADCVPFHLKAMVLIIDDMVNIIDTALEDFKESAQKPKACKRS